MKKTTNYLKLGLFVTVGTTMLVAALYLIGSKQNIFNRTIRIYAIFNNISGLMQGNNVRYAGIDVGTVEKVDILNDSTVLVTMVVQADATKFLHKNSYADIGSDGLMGNKLINIASPRENQLPIHEGDTLYSLKPIATDEMMRTLNTTNVNILEISNDLRKITKRIIESNSLWNILSDTASAENIRITLHNVELASMNAEQFSKDLNVLMTDVQAGKGSFGMLMNDKSTRDSIQATLFNLKATSDTTLIAMHHMKQFMQDLNITPGPLGVLARDTAMANDMRSMIHNMNQGTFILNENLKALQSNFLFRRYFRNQAKKGK